MRSLFVVFSLFLVCGDFAFAQTAPTRTPQRPPTRTPVSPPCNPEDLYSCSVGKQCMGVVAGDGPMVFQCVDTRYRMTINFSEEMEENYFSYGAPHEQPDHRRTVKTAFRWVDVSTGDRRWHASSDFASTSEVTVFRDGVPDFKFLENSWRDLRACSQGSNKLKLALQSSPGEPFYFTDFFSAGSAQDSMMYDQMRYTDCSEFIEGFSFPSSRTSELAAKPTPPILLYSEDNLYAYYIDLHLNYSCESVTDNLVDGKGVAECIGGRSIVWTYLSWNGCVASEPTMYFKSSGTFSIRNDRGAC